MQIIVLEIRHEGFRNNVSVRGKKIQVEQNTLVITLSCSIFRRIRSAEQVINEEEKKNAHPLRARQCLIWITMSATVWASTVWSGAGLWLHRPRKARHSIHVCSLTPSVIQLRKWHDNRFKSIDARYVNAWRDDVMFNAESTNLFRVRRVIVFRLLRGKFMSHRS